MKLNLSIEVSDEALRVLRTIRDNGCAHDFEKMVERYPGTGEAFSAGLIKVWGIDGFAWCDLSNVGRAVLSAADAPAKVDERQKLKDAVVEAARKAQKALAGVVAHKGIVGEPGPSFNDLFTANGDLFDAINALDAPKTIHGLPVVLDPNLPPGGWYLETEDGQIVTPEALDAATKGEG